MALTQSVFTLHVAPAVHGLHKLPPQSTSVSSPLRMLSLQVRAVGLAVGAGVGVADGAGEGEAVGVGVGAGVGVDVGDGVGALVGA